MHSPDNETFSTPPSTPNMPEIRPSLSRRTSRPSHLNIMHNSSDWTPNIVLDPQQSPEIASGKAQSGTPTSTLVNGNGKPNGNGVSVTVEGPPLLSDTPTITHRTVPIPTHTQRRTPSPAINSPCFLHSKLQGASLMDWLGSVYDDKPHDPRERKDDERPTYPDGTVSDSYSDQLSPYADDDEEREYAPSLTKQLAETAVGVREVSKKLGQSSCLVCGVASAPWRCSPHT